MSKERAQEERSDDGLPSLRIVMLDPSASAPWVAHSLSNALSRLGCDVEVVTGVHWDRTIGDLPRSYRLSRPFYKRTQVAAYTAGTLAGRLLWQAMRLVGHIATLARLLPMMWRADVVHVQFLPLPILDHLWLRLVRLRTPVIFSVHDAMPHEYWKERLTRWIRHRLYAVPDRLIAHNSFTAGELRNDFGVAHDRVLEIPYGAFEHMLEMVDGIPRPAADPPEILFFGQITHRKGLDILLRAAARLHERGVAFRVRVMGFARMPMQPMFDLVREAGIDEKVDFDLGWFSEAEIAAAVHRCHIVAVPYRIVSQSAVATVACTLGRAMVGSDAGGLAEFLEASGAGLMASSEDDVALADALERVLRDAVLRADLEAKALHFAEGPLEWDHLATATRVAYESLLPRLGR